MNNIWDVIVVGGGPAGMMAAGRAAELGSKVLLLEKNSTLGKKLLITGGGRCNITNAELDTRKFLEKFRENSKFLFSAFSKFSVKETLDFFHLKELETKVENEGRVFPVSNKSESVLNVLLEYIKQGNVTIMSDSEVTGFVTDEINNQKIVTGVKLKNKSEVKGKSIILATGGISRPETGSTGDGYKWLKEIGHTVIEPTPSLVPIAIKDEWGKRLAGTSLSDIKLTVFQNGVKQETKKGLPGQSGKILFTHVGLSGPSILNMSKDVGELLKYGEVIISLDLLPKLDYSKLNLELQKIFQENDKKKFKNSLSSLIPSALCPIVIELANIDPEKNCNSVTRDERVKLMQLLKGIPMNADKLLGVEKAVISSGGVILDEVDFKTMSSRLYPNLFLIGDILNIDRPSGGYSLQLCWTTGYIAGSSVVL